MFFARRKIEMPRPDTAPPGRAAAIPTAERHFVNGRPLKGPWPDDCESALFGMGCFWGAERRFWELGEGVHVTAVGYAGGFTPNPTYEEVCSGLTGHNEVALVVYHPRVLPFARLLKTFWEAHDPTQGMRQGNDVGAQYRSGVYVADAARRAEAEASGAVYAAALAARRLGPITTEILDLPPFYFAEAWHQQYLAKNPGGYCGLGGTGVACPGGADDHA
jgi:peptide-methionine (S)-S-oxide reductase